MLRRFRNPAIFAGKAVFNVARIAPKSLKNFRKSLFQRSEFLSSSLVDLKVSINLLRFIGRDRVIPGCCAAGSKRLMQEQFKRLVAAQ